MEKKSENFKKKLAQVVDNIEQSEKLNQEPIRDEDWDDFDEMVEEFRKNPPSDLIELCNSARKSIRRGIEEGRI